MVEREEFDFKLDRLLDHAEQLIPNELLEDLLFMEHKRTWIKNIAKKYVQKYK